MNYVLRLMGVWFFPDGWFSLACYIGKPGQSWIKDHSIRVIRMGLGILLIVIGAINQ